MRFFWANIAAIALLASPASFSSGVGDAPATYSLDGKTFYGKIRARGLLGLFAKKSVLRFEGQLFSWSSGEDFRPAAYETREENGKIIFTAHAVGNEGAYANDYVDWRGEYDGESLSNVTAVWTRAQGGGDWLHDLLLPQTVTFSFKPAKP
ncbi:MAG: hypothetical protein HKP32_03655 [Woeseia sp.]|nr:hypothetical protein [Woeseia sp.]NNL54231.1 hypothetical protein [Woeseia sp.]